MMRKIAGVLVVLIVVALFVNRAQIAPHAPSNTAGVITPSTVEENSPTTKDGAPYYPVVKVVDGDTLVVDMNGKTETLRLIGLDTPETVDPRKPVQCFGKEASEKAKEVLSGAKIRIEGDASQGERDKYGRLLAYVFLPSGTLFNQYMIAQGYGHEYTYNLPYKYQKQFKESEILAREGKIGLWADGACASKTSVSKSFSSPAPPDTNDYECTKNVYNCSNFKTHAEAQNAFDSCGGTSNDVHKLDSDGDGNVCESLP